MLSTTFLGHQGWMFRSERAAVLVDPLLCEDFGQAHALEYRVWPPRVWTPAAMPKLDAVVLSHEHDDHFDIPSLARLDRAIPIYLSTRSSTAARSILATMGFTVHPLVPGTPLKFGDLELTPFAGDHLAADCGDEWDTLPFLVRHTEGHGSFFSMVDIPLQPIHLEWVATRAMRPGIISWTNNAMDWSHMASYLVERVEGTQQCFINMGMGHKLIEQSWGTPAAMVMCAGGMAFTGERAWLNQRVFCVDTDAVCANMQKVYKKEKFYAGVPGQTWHLAANKLKSVDDSTPFLTTAPRETWPSRAKGDVAVRDYPPGCGRTELESWERLRANLDAFAGSLVGTHLFKSLHSLLDSETDRKPTFVFVLRDGDRRRVFAYDPRACAFPEIDDTDPERTYLAGFECWATDLDAVLAGEMGPIGLTFGRSRLWNALSKRFAFDIFPSLHRVSHPLRLPAAYLELYERLWEPVRDTKPEIFAR